MLRLRGGHRSMTFTRESFLFGSWPGTKAASPTVIADTVYADIIDDRLGVRVMDDRPVHVHDRSVVVEVVGLPVPAGEAGADVTESVVDAAVESDVRAPVTGVPDVGAFVPAPVSWSPQEADFRCLHPGARNPVVVAIIGAPSPVTGRPKIAVAGTDRLGVHGQNRWRNRDGYSDTLREGTARNGDHRDDHQDQTEPTHRQRQRSDRSHCVSPRHHVELSAENVG